MNIFGVGLDLVDIERMRRALSHPRFLTRWFDALEIEYILTKTNQAQSAAAIFAAKEAFVKSIGRGFSGISPRDIPVCRDSHGKPHIHAPRELLARLDLPSNLAFELSLTHSTHTAAAVVIAVQPD